MANKLIGPFAANIPAVSLFQGRDFIQSESETINLFDSPRDFFSGDWTKLQSTITPNDVFAPDGTLTADKIVEDVTVGGSHGVEQSITPDGASVYQDYFFLRAAERGWAYLVIESDGFTSVETAYINLATGALGAVSGVPLVDYFGNGWWRISVPATSNAAVATDIRVYTATSNGGVVHNGDGTSGIYIWHGQMAKGTFPKSPIVGTKAKDNSYWEEADVPAALRGAFSFEWATYGDHTVTGNRYFFDFQASGSSHRIGIYYRQASSSIRVYDFTAAATLVDSGALTFDSLQVPIITLDNSLGLINVSGVLTGGDTVIGTPWGTTAGRVYCGQDINSNNQCEGALSVPYAKAA